MHHDTSISHVLEKSLEAIHDVLEPNVQPHVLENFVCDTLHLPLHPIKPTLPWPETAAPVTQEKCMFN